MKLSIALLCGAPLEPAPLAHQVDPCGRLEGPDQDRRGAPVGLGDGVEEAVDPVGQVDVGPPGRPE
jgi:hypothetical protein